MPSELLTASPLSVPAAKKWRTVLAQACVPALLVHALLFVGLYSMLYSFGIVNHGPESSRLLSWDAAIFRLVADTGYDDPALGKNAFFPFFPYFWRFSHLGPLGISILNLSITLLGASIIAYTFRLTSRQLLLIVSLPAMLFTWVPYSEGFAFLFGALLLRGLHRRHLALTIVGLLVCCLNRAATTIFLPAFLFAEIATWDNHGRLSQRSWVRLSGGLLAMAGALGLVMYLQYRLTGDALAFYHVHALWDHTFSLPSFPFTDSPGINVLWLDSMTLLLAVASTVACLVAGCWWLTRLASAVRRQAGPALPVSRAVLFALSYCVGAAFFIVFFQRGDLQGLSRYILASPFAGIVLWQLWQLRPASKWLLVATGVGCLVISLALGFPFRFSSYLAGEATWYFLLFSVYVFAFLFSVEGSSRWYREISASLYVLNLLLMAHLLNVFLDGAWVG